MILVNFETITWEETEDAVKRGDDDLDHILDRFLVYHRVDKVDKRGKSYF